MTGTFLLPLAGKAAKVNRCHVNILVAMAPDCKLRSHFGRQRTHWPDKVLDRIEIIIACNVASEYFLQGPAS